MIDQPAPMTHTSNARRKNSEMREAPTLKQLLASQSTLELMEAHNGISAICAANAGFRAIWASGFSIASSLGLRDCNEASMSEVLQVVEYMTAAVRTPILVDGDTGFGNYNNVRRLVQKLSRMGAAGVCLEDKQFPKMNSFVGDAHSLVTIEEFCGKIQAAREARIDDSFVVVARTEALIDNRSISEAIERADAYGVAGADAIVIHSRSSRPDDVLEFARRWNRRLPLIAIPTTYPQVSTSELSSAGVGAVIWANQLLRASVAAMVGVCRTIRDSGGIASLEGTIATMAQVRELCAYDELVNAEERFGGSKRVAKAEAAEVGSDSH